MKELTLESEYKEIFKTAGNRLLVLLFGAAWCGPCRMMAPYLDKLETEYEGSVLFAKVDVDELPDLAEDEGIECMPTFILYKDNKKITEMPGANKTKLKELIDQNK
ncbi:hypothetical protein LOTGIDRAFT_232353 [Lottia gigantea]|uniref:Thioredoxin n=1 Tax=Lottia gigantea TaxID=225164 RepID=V4AH64_LOTGI|nr:hypothetical protein LOTGIDRAFT_232353 [Lottia gigantea]ESO94520.1 hypothetical protein LOTGIDRAFT_232353 [Lottia gigantea]